MVLRLRLNLRFYMVKRNQKYFMTHVIRLCIISAFELQCWSWKIETETTQLSKAKTFPIWPFTEKSANPWAKVSLNKEFHRATSWWSRLIEFTALPVPLSFAKKLCSAFGLSHITHFDQWESKRHTTSRGLNWDGTLGLVLLLLCHCPVSRPGKSAGGWVMWGRASRPVIPAKARLG